VTPEALRSPSAECLGRLHGSYLDGLENGELEKGPILAARGLVASCGRSGLGRIDRKGRYG
jgi:hypothetical protein